MTSKPFVSRTLATLRRAEFGFFGVVVYTRVHTPRFCGQASIAGTLFRFTLLSRGLRISCCIVGIAPHSIETAQGSPVRQHNSADTPREAGARRKYQRISRPESPQAEDHGP